MTLRSYGPHHLHLPSPAGLSHFVTPARRPPAPTRRDTASPSHRRPQHAEPCGVEPSSRRPVGVGRPLLCRAASSRLRGCPWPGTCAIHSGPTCPGGCPQPWTEVDTGEALVECGSCRYAVGDRGRLVEKLSPGMCTGWGDLVAAGSRLVTDRLIRRRPGAASRTGRGSMDNVLTCVYVRSFPESGFRRPAARRRAGRRLRTTWGSSRETQGTAGGRATATVHNRRDVHVSTQVGR